MKAKTVAERVKKSDDKHRSLGRKGRKVWATPEEHFAIRAFLDKLRWTEIK